MAAGGQVRRKEEPHSTVAFGKRAVEFLKTTARRPDQYAAQVVADR
jgi:hypothetical protein